jgi:BCD family chlorophyll transporter-like MFS transporter
MGVLALGGVLATNATLMMSSSPIFGVLLGILAFTMIGAGVGGIVLAVVVVVAIGLVRRRLLLGVVVAAAVAGATVSSQVLKRWAITRPPTAGELARISANSFPSGHATICTALGLAVLVLGGLTVRIARSEPTAP